MRNSLLAALLGAWLAVTLATWFSAAASFVTAGHLLSPASDPSEANERWRQAMAAVGDARGVARHQAADFNRRMFSASGAVQLVLAGICVLVAAWPPRLGRGRMLTFLAAALLVGATALVIVPRAAAIGRVVVLPPPDAPAAQVEEGHARMTLLHRVYGLLDVSKSALLAAALVLTLREAGRVTRR